MFATRLLMLMLFGLGAAASVAAHVGGLDSLGGHNNTATGKYECGAVVNGQHTGPTYATKQAMIDAIGKCPDPRTTTPPVPAPAPAPTPVVETYSLFPDTLIPTVFSAADGEVNLSLLTFVDKEVYTPALRFYRDAKNTGFQIGRLYECATILCPIAERKVLATTEKITTGSGYVLLKFPQPLTLKPGVFYLPTVYTSAGWSHIVGGTLNQINSGPLHSVAKGSRNTYGGPTLFPDKYWSADPYYGVDMVVQTALPPPPPPPAPLTEHQQILKELQSMYCAIAEHFVEPNAVLDYEWIQPNHTPTAWAGLYEKGAALTSTPLQKHVLPAGDRGYLTWQMPNRDADLEIWTFDKEGGTRLHRYVNIKVRMP